jgi:hypothetical protein
LLSHPPWSPFGCCDTLRPASIVTGGDVLILAALVGIMMFAPAFGFTRAQALLIDVKVGAAWIVLDSRRFRPRPERRSSTTARLTARAG